MKYFELTLYIYGKKQPLCKVLFETRQVLDDFLSKLSSDLEIIKLGEVIFRRKDFHYAEIKEKQIRR